MKFAVTGATGQLGRLVIEALKTQAGAGAVAALARTPGKAADLGVETREADYDRPETLAPALAGVGTLLLISGSEIGRRTAQHQAVIDAAKAAGVGRIVYTSLLRAPTSPLSLADEHRATEAALAASGVPHTILRNGWYLENHTAGVSAALELGALYGAAGEGRFSSAARADYAAAAVAAMTDPGHAGAVHELAGDMPFTLAEFAAELSRQTGREIPFVNLPEADYAKALAGAGLPEGFAAALASFDTAAAQGALEADDRTLSRLIGRPTTTLAEAIRAAAAAAVEPAH